MTWLELPVPTGTIPIPAIGSWLAAERRAGTVDQGLFLREPGEPGRRRLIVQARGPAGGTAAALRRLADDTIPPAVRTATIVPLQGSAFAGPALAEVTRDFLATVTPTLATLCPPADSPSSARLAAALDLMAAHLPALGPPAVPGADRVAGLLGGAPIGVLSLRSHADAFIATSRDPAVTRRAFDERFAAVRRPVEQRLTAVLDQIAGRGPTVSPAAAQWHAAVVAARPGILRRVESGALTVHDGSGDPAAFTASAFHTTAAGSTTLQTFLHTDPAFVTTRLLTSLLYLSLHHVGLSLTERWLLCHAVSRACESVFGVDPVAVLAGLAAG
ncbi:hypothetical protein [Actinoplanes xinjiangensis]|uniref:hypothetical protein n=1 Tax=Actinoplanes xinjiangensis TaxID=512350 RepID=UPI00341C952E